LVRKTHYPPIDFTRAPGTLANELRYVTSVKSARMSWRHGGHISNVLRGAIDLAVKYGFNSLHEFPVPPAKVHGGACLATIFPTESGAPARSLASSIRGLRQILDEVCDDPWDADIWRATLLKPPGENNHEAVAAIRWTNVTCDWLRTGLKSLAREHLQSGSRAWTTIQSYPRGGSLLCRYFDEEIGQLEPSGMSRAIFLDFVAWVRDEDTTPTDMRAVNTLERLLIELRIGDVVPELPDTVYLLRGENATPITRNPKPFPADILESIDSLIADESALPRSERLMLRLCRAIGPRTSEALTLPRDSVTYVDGRGYTLEYFQSKVQDWRRVPLPPKLGRDLVQQSQWVAETYGSDCRWIFPYTGTSPRIDTLMRPDAIGPWPYGRLRAFFWKVYQQHGIVESALTGETLTGPQLHRFRHSIATGLLNEGWTQYEVQTFLGHKSAIMMQSYAEINDDSLREKYLEYMKGSVDFDGRKVDTADNAAVDVERLRDRFMRSTLPNGFCTLPEKQRCEYLPSPCLSCTFFRTTRTYLPIHIRQRDDAIRELDLAREDGRQRAAEVHEKTITQLNKIIDGLNQAEASETTDDH
jgi:integrase